MNRVRTSWAGVNGQNGPDGRPLNPDLSIASMSSMMSIASFAEIAANEAHALAGVACVLLDRQVSRLAADFETDGGFTERLYQVRSARRVKQ